MYNVICVYTGTKYNVKFVNILYNMVERNLSKPFNFYCLTDNQGQKFNPNIKLLDIPQPVLRTWWNKMHLFNPALNIEGNILYVDLDVVITGSLDEFFTDYKDEDFCVIRDFGQPDAIFNSSVLRYNIKHHKHIWHTYIADKMRYRGHHGDQTVITEIMKDKPETKIMPDVWTYSFKWQERGKIGSYMKDDPTAHPYKPGSKICVFHGNPNPDEAVKNRSGKWIESHWF